MTLQEIRAKIQSWRVNSTEENNQYVDILITLVDHLINLEKNK